MLKEQIDFNEFLDIEKRLEIRYGQIVNADRVPKSQKLLKLTVIFGPDESDEKIILTNLGDRFQPDEFLGITLPFITNLKPVTMMGIESQGMIMVATKGDNIELTNPSIGANIL